MEQKKLFFLNSCVEWGGGEKWTLETAEAFFNRGYDVTVGSVPESELYQKAEAKGISVQEVPVKGSLSVLNPLKLKSFVNYLQREEVTTLFLNLSQDLKFGGVAGKLAGVEQIIYRRGSAIPIKDRFYTEFLLEDCVTDIIANSQATKRTILQNTSDWLSEEKIEIIYNGIKLAEVERELETGTEDLRAELEVGPETTLIANVGRLNVQKGHQYLLEAVDRMRQKISDFKVLIVGKGELESKLKAQAQELGIEEYVVFTGFRTDIYNLLSQVDFMLHTALWEGFGFVIAEAMAVGLPVVSTDVSNIAELVVDGKTGYLAESENSEDIAAKAVEMYQEEEREQMGQRGKVRVEEYFTFERMIERIEHLYLENEI